MNIWKTEDLDARIECSNKTDFSEMQTAAVDCRSSKLGGK